MSCHNTQVLTNFIISRKFFQPFHIKFTLHGKERRVQMTNQTAQSLKATLGSFNGFEWAKHPVQELLSATTGLRRIPDLRLTVADLLEDPGFRPHPIELITRTDLALHNHPRGDIAIRLHLCQTTISPETRNRPEINAKGYLQSTIVLLGRIVCQHFVYEGKVGEVIFNHEYLRGTGHREYRTGDAFTLERDQIHRLSEIDKGTVTLTISVLRDAQPYRVYLRQHDVYVVEAREPRQRIARSIARHLRNAM